METNYEERKQQIQARWKWAIGLGAVLIIAPLTTTILWGLVGAAALAGGAVVGFIGLQMAPVFALKVANRRIKELVAEAEANPIETMQTIYIDKSKELREKKQNLEEWDTELRNYDDELVQIVRDYPDEAPKYRAIGDEMHAALVSAQEGVVEFEQNLQEAARVIRKMQSLYKIALAAQRVTQFSKSAEQKVFEDIKQQAAMDSVRTNLNRSFSKLNAAMAERTRRQPILPAKKEAGQ